LQIFQPNPNSFKNSHKSQSNPQNPFKKIPVNRESKQRKNKGKAQKYIILFFCETSAEKKRKTVSRKLHNKFSIEQKKKNISYAFC
jgi:hypothetical protein